jgi:hypothetical protein
VLPAVLSMTRLYPERKRYSICCCQFGEQFYGERYHALSLVGTLYTPTQMDLYFCGLGKRDVPKEGPSALMTIVSICEKCDRLDVGFKDKAFL